MTHLSLFSGIGGLDLAAEWAGFETVGQCEWADYPTKVLEKHWPNVPRWRDIRTLTGKDLYERTGLRTVDIISGGFPCQPFSVAGKQKGKEDNRYLWPEMLRVIRELAPRWVVGENVPGILNIAADGICADLEREGYEVGIFDFEAAAVGAPHRRERICFLAHSGRLGRGGRRDGNARELYGPLQTARSSSREEREVLADTKNSDRWRASCEEYSGRRDAKARGRSIGRCGIQHWSIEPDVGRVAHGVPSRVDRLKCLGNAVVPQQFYPIFKAIAEVEEQYEP
jgi:DNA (cytosine-5)-methyltransferase 1